MSVAVCSTTAVKFVTKPSSHIVCQLCKKVFTNPVINVKCGHTYCMTCVTKSSDTGDSASVVRCPEDGMECNVTELVQNRFNSVGSFGHAFLSYLLWCIHVYIGTMNVYLEKSYTTVWKHMVCIAEHTRTH